MADTTMPHGSNVRDGDCVPCGVKSTQVAAPQGDLCLPDPDRFSKQWEEVLAVLNEIIAVASLKEAAFVIGVSDKALGHALSERERHYPRWDWHPAICSLARRHGFAERLGLVLVAPLGLGVCSPVITDSEWRRRVELSLAKMGPLEQAVLTEAGLR